MWFRHRELEDLTFLRRIGAQKSWNGQYTVPCEKRSSLPDFTLVFGGKPYVLTGTDYVLDLGGTCVSAFTGLDINPPGGGSLWIIGKLASLITFSRQRFTTGCRRRFLEAIFHSLRSRKGRSWLRSLLLNE